MGISSLHLPHLGVAFPWVSASLVHAFIFNDKSYFAASRTILNALEIVPFFIVRVLQCCLSLSQVSTSPRHFAISFRRKEDCTREKWAVGSDPWVRGWMCRFMLNQKLSSKRGVVKEFLLIVLWPVVLAVLNCDLDCNCQANQTYLIYLHPMVAPLPVGIESTSWMSSVFSVSAIN